MYYNKRSWWGSYHMDSNVRKTQDVNSPCSMLSITDVVAPGPIERMLDIVEDYYLGSEESSIASGAVSAILNGGWLF